MSGPCESRRRRLKRSSRKNLGYLSSTLYAPGSPEYSSLHAVCWCVSDSDYNVDWARFYVEVNRTEPVGKCLRTSLICLQSSSYTEEPRQLRRGVALSNQFYVHPRSHQPAASLPVHFTKLTIWKVQSRYGLGKIKRCCSIAAHPKCLLAFGFLEYPTKTQEIFSNFDERQGSQKDKLIEQDL